MYFCYGGESATMTDAEGPQYVVLIDLIGSRAIDVVSMR